MKADIHLNCIKYFNSFLTEHTVISTAKTNWLVLCEEIVGPYYENHKNTHKYIVWAKCGVINVAAHGTVRLSIVYLNN